MNIYPLIRKDLEEQAKEGKKEKCECGAPWQAHLNLIGQSCHPGIGLLIAFHPNTGCLLLSCPACKEAFGMIQVAKKMDKCFKDIEAEEIIAFVIGITEVHKRHKDRPEPPTDPSRN